MSNVLSESIHELDPWKLKRALDSGLSPPSVMVYGSGATRAERWSKEGSALDVLSHIASEKMIYLCWSTSNTMIQRIESKDIMRKACDIIDLLAPYSLKVDAGNAWKFIRSCGAVVHDPGTVYTESFKKLVN